jgi:hypothetical protein
MTGPTIRLALCLGGGGGPMTPERIAATINGPSVRLAYHPEGGGP